MKLTQTGKRTADVLFFTKMNHHDQKMKLDQLNSKLLQKKWYSCYDESF